MYHTRIILKHRSSNFYWIFWYRKSKYIEWLKTIFLAIWVTWLDYNRGKPDLNQLDFYFWDHMKQKIHEGSPRNLMEVKNLIGDFVNQTSGDGELLKRVTAKFRSSVKRCIQAKGGLFGYFFCVWIKKWW